MTGIPNPDILDLTELMENDEVYRFIDRITEIRNLNIDTFDFTELIRFVTKYEGPPRPVWSIALDYFEDRYGKGPNLNIFKFVSDALDLICGLLPPNTVQPSLYDELVYCSKWSDYDK